MKELQELLKALAMAFIVVKALIELALLNLK